MSEAVVQMRPRTPSVVDTGATSLALLMRLAGIPAEPAALLHEIGKPAGGSDDRDLIRLAQRRELRARRVRTQWERLARIALPAITKGTRGEYFVLARVAEDAALVHRVDEAKPRRLSRQELEECWTGELILVSPRAGLGGARRPFGLSWFVPAVVRFRRLFGEVLLASFFIQLFALVTPLFFQAVIDKVLVHRALSTLDVVVAGLLGIACFECALTALRTYLFSHTATRVDIELGARLFNHMLHLPIGYVLARRVGDTIARMRELESIRSFLTGSALTLVLDLFFTFVFFVAMYAYAPVLTAIVLGSIPLYVGISLFVTPVLRGRVDEKFRRGAENQAFLVEAVNGIETLKAMAVEPQMQRRWEDQLAGYVRAGFRAGTLGSMSSQAVHLVQRLTYAAVLWTGARLVIDGELTVGQLIAFNMLSGQVTAPILRLAPMWQDFQQVRVSVERVGDIFNQVAEPGATGRRSLPRLEGRITFQNVSFAYEPGGIEVLRDFDLEIPAGAVVGLVGPSGSGKSTITRLLQRLQVPGRGRVLVDGTDLATVDPSWLRRQIGVVLQENVLFNTSVRENIALADPGMSMDRVVAAARTAGAHDFILELPQGYDTLIGERGSSLSGGQRQRIAIARALIGEPRILILDEATSALDYESERIIHDHMARICGGRTVVIIAHRLEAVRHADRILSIERGRITESGTHAELLQRRGLYARLHSLQVGSDAVA